MSTLHDATNGAEPPDDAGRLTGSAPSQAAMIFASRRRLAFLLRLWHCCEEDGKPVWRASLEDAHTGERLGFASLDALVSFLKQGTHQDARPAAPGGEERAKSLPPCLEVQPSAGEGTGEKS